MKILITGGAGFIGSHLCEQLIENNEVICVDNFSTGNFENIKKLLGHPNFKLLNHDVVNPLDIKVDQIYNLACPASPDHYQKDPISTIRTNVLGALNILELAQKSNAKLLQASTSEVYGDPLEHPQKESYFGNVNPIGPRSCYDESKRCAEAILSNYPTKIVRIFNTYGPRMDVDDGRVISNFIVSALKNRFLIMYGNGSQTRSFMYVDDLVKGLIKVMESDYTGPINLGNPHEITIENLAFKIIEMTGSKSHVKSDLTKYRQDDPVRRKPDITLAKSLDWEPRVLLNQGLEETISYFSVLLNQANT